MTPRAHLDRATARRFLAARHLLAPPRSLPAGAESVLTVVDRLGSLQFDPLDVTGRNHDLVLAARIAGYRRTWADELLYGSRRLYEAYNKGLSIVPTAELPWYRIGWDLALAEHEGAAFVEHRELVDELLERIRRAGPLSSTDVAPRAAIDWYWRPTNQVRAILEALAESGILALARREGNRRIYDLTERLFPPELLAERRPTRAQWRQKLLSRYRAHGLLGATGSAEIWIGAAPRARRASTTGNGTEPTRADLLRELVEEGALVPVTVEGVRGVRHVLADEWALLEASEGADAGAGAAAARDGADGAASRVDGRGGVALLAPLDPFVWDRDLLRSLYDFDYVWEVYVPAARRRWGYYVLPILSGDRLVGRIEPRADRLTRTLRIVDAWWQDGFDPLVAPRFVDDLADALAAHARFLDLDRIALPRATRHRPLARQVRDRLGAGGRVSP